MLRRLRYKTMNAAFVIREILPRLSVKKNVNSR